MAAFETIKAKLTALLGKANETTGGADTNLTDAVDRLRDGFGTGAVTEPLLVTENGSYRPPEGVDGFDPVDVSVSIALPAITTPASPEEVRQGWEYIGADGEVHTGEMPERSSDDVTITKQGDRQDFMVTVASGYYPSEITLAGAAGGNADMTIGMDTITVGSNIFSVNFISSLVVWYMIWESVFGTGMYYMPATVVLAFDSPVIFNGAFYAGSIDASGTNQITYSGSDITGAYRLVMALEGSASGNKLLSITMTNNGETVEVADGLYAGVCFSCLIV